MTQPRVGTRKLHAMLQPELAQTGIHLGRDALFDLLRRARLLVANRRAYHKTTDSHHQFRRHPNLLNGDLKRIPQRPDEVAMAFRKALKQRQSNLPLIHHSDRGIEYCSSLYQDLHAKHGVTCSMTDGYDCYQNALAERVNGILKGEFLLNKPANLDEARKMVDQSVQIYNQKRLHLSLKYKTPDAVHRAFFAT